MTAQDGFAPPQVGYAPIGAPQYPSQPYGAPYNTTGILHGHVVLILHEPKLLLFAHLSQSSLRKHAHAIYSNILQL